MKKLQTLCFVIVFLVTCQPAKKLNPNLSLWYQQPADEWMKSTPLGNGRLGAMVFGGISIEKLALNEVSMWSGRPESIQDVRTDGKERLASVRKLFFEGDYAEGSRMASSELLIRSRSFGTHVPVGDMIINFGHDESAVSAYKRALNLEDAITRVSYKLNGITYRREYLCSNPDDVLAVKLSADKKGKIDFELGMNMTRESDSVTFKVNNNSLDFEGKVFFPRFGQGGVRFAGKINITTVGGVIQAGDTTLKVSGADEAVVMLDIRTDYDDPGYLSKCHTTLENAVTSGFEAIRKKHITDYRQLFDRVDINLGDSEANKLPTDIRWQLVKSGQEDPGLDALFFQYGRYLLIASSRKNAPLPSNLQGIWNDNLACNMGWTCDYHLDINIQQNYWLSNITNLHECNAPLFRFIQFLAEHGAKTNQDIYGSPGWSAHTVVNAWGHTAPTSIYWGLFPTAGAWIASHLWSHYEYTKDKEFLEKTAYPILKGAAIFLLDYMTELPGTGYLATGPSISPENSFLYNDIQFTLSMMPTCDRVLVNETFMSCIHASEILGADIELRQKLEDAIKKIPPLKIGKKGTLQEWFEDFEEASPNHRHTTHLLALYPFSQITPVHTPELADAARQTIINRLNAPGWEDVEWSRANMINFYARLKEPQKAFESCAILLNTFTRENMLTISPEGIAGAPWDIFIIDGNGAGTAGIAEMLIQNHEGYVEFLPALPKQWHTGHFKGLCVKGGAETNAQWKDGKLKHAVIKATADGCFDVRLPEDPKHIIFNGKYQKSYSPHDTVISLKLKKDDVWEAKF